MTGTHRVLVVDDEGLVRDLLSRALARWGYEAVVASSGEEALRALESGPVSAAVLDLYLESGPHGLDLLAQIRKTPGGAALPVLILTAENHPILRARARRAGADDYFMKGRLDLEAFFRRLDQLVGRVRLPLERTAADPASLRGGPLSNAPAAAPPSVPVPFWTLPHIRPDLVEIRLRHLTGLSPLPAITQELVRTAAFPEATLDTIVQVLRTDQALAARVLKIANSTLFGGRERVVTLDRAVVKIGLNGIRDLAIGLSIAGRAGRVSSSELRPASAAWEHELAVAVAARELARRSGRADPELAFVAGLLHDIGKDAFDDLFPAAYAAVLQRAARGDAPTDVERQVFGVDHAELGRRVLEHWGIPAPLPDIVGRHHARAVHAEKAADGARETAALVRIADALAHAARIGVAPVDRIENVTDDDLAAAGVDVEWMTSVAEGLPAGVNELRSVLLLAEPPAPWTGEPPRADGIPRRARLETDDRATRCLMTVFLQSMGWEVQTEPGEPCDLAVGCRLDAESAALFSARASGSGVGRIVVLARPGTHSFHPPPGVTVLPLPASLASVAAACGIGHEAPAQEAPAIVAADP